MDAYEATRIVFSRIQSLDPENASKIMGLLLIQDHGEKEMIRLAFGPEALVHSVVLKARKDLGLSSNTPSTPSTPSSPSPFLSRQNSSSSRMLSSNGPNLPPTLTTMASSSWTPPSAFCDIQASDDLISPNSATASASASYAAAASANMVVASSSSSLYSTSLTSPFYGYGSDVPVDEFQLQDQLSFLSDASSTLGPKTATDLFYPQPETVASPNGRTGGDATLFPSYAAAAAGATSWGTTIDGHHRRSCSVNDICFGSEAGSGYGWKPCLYFARGYCKNGSSCRFLHGLPDSSPVVADAAAMGSSPNKLDRLDVVEQCQELLRSKSTQQRLVNSSQLMASASFPYGTATAGKCMNFLLQQQQQQQQQNDTTQRTAAGLMLGEDIHKLGRSRLERNDFSTTGGGMVNPGSRQIYLTFPADSTFREEDVSNYFSIYGPVQDVRIPYQQKRMFGFVTFVYPETVKLILAKGNPHFVCDARVLVKPYKEKGKVPDKKQQQSERGEFSACSIPTGVDIRDAYDLQLGPRMFYDAQDMLLRRKLEDHADLRQALELQGRKLMGLQLLDVKKYHHHHHHSLSTGAQVASPTQNHVNHTFVLPSERGSPEAPEENCANAETTIYGAADRQLRQAANSDEESIGEDEIGNGKEKRPNQEDSNFQDGVEHYLPDSPFASPTKFGEPTCVSTASDAALASESGAALASSCNSKLITTSLLPATSTLDVASFKSCFFQMPRFPSGHGAIGM
ncbi:zinc finger CCCH domain-containing protein 53-like isoform X2 [Macadamia integrifolia]|uniref:zinc finger CCCH domain-containing protein 53-like isoform X2 n=1 Tax=Macadamia integrifolia TaxID=60698 RepID=UPI001C4F21F9|nr:zinc finger CCCH domain-containing protein 53-like isoform X2 [Macadamia integrifolia]